MTDGGAVGPAAPAAPAAPVDPARSPAIALVIAAVLIFIGVISKSWISAGRSDFEVHVGPIGAEACMASVCRDAGGMTNKLDGDITLFQMVALLGGFAAVAAAGAFGGMTLAGKRDRLPSWKVANVAFGLAAFGMSYFTFRLLAKGNGASIGWAVFPGLGGVIVAGVYLRKLKHFLPAAGAQPPHVTTPAQPYGQSYGQQSFAQQSQPMPPQQPYGQPPQPAPQGAPPCPRCGTPLEFVHQYQRWFCPREQQYV